MQLKTNKLYANTYLKKYINIYIMNTLFENIRKREQIILLIRRLTVLIHGDQM